MEQKFWIFPLEEKITSEETNKLLLSSIKSFLETWHAHGEKVTGVVSLVEKQLIVISLEPNSIIPSGCSKDQLDKSIRDICTKLGLALADEAKVVAKIGSNVMIFSRSDFKNSVSEFNQNDISIVDYSILGTDTMSLDKIFIPIQQTWAANLLTKQ